LLVSLSGKNSAMAINIAFLNHYFDELGVPDSPRNLNSPNCRMRTRLAGGVEGIPRDCLGILQRAISSASSSPERTSRR